MRPMMVAYLVWDQLDRGQCSFIGTGGGGVEGLAGRQNFVIFVLQTTMTRHSYRFWMDFPPKSVRMLRFTGGKFHVREGLRG